MPTVAPARARLRGIVATTIDGGEVDLGVYASEVTLVVNVASRCGLAPQYEGLERLQRRFGPRGFTVLGFPSNQFLQELGSAEAIKDYCSSTWGVSFPMFAAIRVNGRTRHPLYAELTPFPDSHGRAGRIAWNFEKFVISPSGEVARFRPTVAPEAPEVVEAIERALVASGR